MRSLIPKLLIALKHLIQADQVRGFFFITLLIHLKYVLTTHLSTHQVTVLFFQPIQRTCLYSCWVFVWQDQASEAMEVFDELMESEVAIVVPHIAEIVRFCLEVGLHFTHVCLSFNSCC